MKTLPLRGSSGPQRIKVRAAIPPAMPVRAVLPARHLLLERFQITELTPVALANTPVLGPLGCRMLGPTLMTLICVKSSRGQLAL